MKCEHCGKNEVSFVYRSSVNGQTEEKHLCADCARKLGYDRYLTDGGRAMMRNLFNGGWFGSNNNNMENFFGGMPFVTGGSFLTGRMIDNPFDDMFSEMPALGSIPTRKETKPDDNRLMDEESGNEFARQRKLNAMRMELQKAVASEDYERAAQLRDEIRRAEIQSDGVK